MLSYRDMAFCSRWRACAKAKTCPRSLHDEQEALKQGLPIAYAHFTNCFVPKGPPNDPPGTPQTP